MCVFILQKKKSSGIVMKMLFAVLVVDVCEFSVLLVKKLLLFNGQWEVDVGRTVNRGTSCRTKSATCVP